MTSFIEKGLKKVAKAQYKYANLFLILTLIFTIIMAIGASKIWIQTDFNKEMPQDLPIFLFNNKIEDKFGGQEIVIVELLIDQNSNEPTGIKDIRDPRVFEFMKLLSNYLESESSISSITSPLLFTNNYVPKTLKESKSILKQIPDSGALYNKDHTFTAMYLASDVGSSEEKIKQLSNLIEEKINETPIPTGLKVQVTGTPLLRTLMIDLLVGDVFITLGWATILIFILLLIIERSLNKSIIIFTPLCLGLIWTVGMMGWLNIPLSIATVGLGAMIIGLGIEYGVFIVTRYKEERKTKHQEAALISALPAAGAAITASSITTIIGFLALVLSSMPMLQHLGETLALGIFFSVFAALIINPMIILKEEEFEKWFVHKMHDAFLIRKNKQKSSIGDDYE